MPFSHQIVNTKPHGTVAGYGNRIIGSSGQIPVDQHDRETIGDRGRQALAVRHGRGKDQAVHQAAGQHIQAFRFPNRVFPGIQHQQAIAFLCQNVLHLLNHGGKIGIGNIRNHKAYQIPFPGFEAASCRIRDIV